MVFSNSSLALKYKSHTNFFHPSIFANWAIFIVISNADNVHLPFFHLYSREKYYWSPSWRTLQHPSTPPHSILLPPTQQTSSSGWRRADGIHGLKEIIIDWCGPCGWFSWTATPLRQTRRETEAPSIGFLSVSLQRRLSMRLSHPSWISFYPSQDHLSPSLLCMRSTPNIAPHNYCQSTIGEAGDLIGLTSFII